MALAVSHQQGQEIISIVHDSASVVILGIDDVRRTLIYTFGHEEVARQDTATFFRWTIHEQDTTSQSFQLE